MPTPTVPVLDIGRLMERATLAELDAACRDWGIFHVVGHGIPDAVTAQLFSQVRAFFSRPLEEKRRIERSANNPWGFFDRELTKNRRDLKEIYDVGPAGGATIAPQWPDDMPGFRDAVQTWYRYSERLARRLLDAIAVNLGVVPDVLESAIGKDHTSFLRLNHYPAATGDAAGEHGLGISPHTDAGALTVLRQDDQPGLEVLRDGAWHLVEPRPDALVINIGDVVQVWSNDRYMAALHRVLASGATPRFSVPFFLNPAYRADYAPLPTTVSANHPARYRAINWGEFRARRAAGDYADHGEEVQIAQYRVSA